MAVKKICCEKKQQRPQMGVPHIIGLISIRNTAQGMNMIICRGLKTKRAEGREEDAAGEKKFEQEGPVLNPAKCVDADV